MVTPDRWGLDRNRRNTHDALDVLGVVGVTTGLGVEVVVGDGRHPVGGGGAAGDLLVVEVKGCNIVDHARPAARGGGSKLDLAVPRLPYRRAVVVVESLHLGAFKPATQLVGRFGVGVGRVAGDAVRPIAEEVVGKAIEVCAVNGGPKTEERRAKGTRLARVGVGLDLDVDVKEARVFLARASRPSRNVSTAEIGDAHLAAGADKVAHPLPGFSGVSLAGLTAGVVQFAIGIKGGIGVGIGGRAVIAALVNAASHFGVEQVILALVGQRRQCPLVCAGL